MTCAPQGDPEPVASPIVLHGATLKPLTPVHGHSEWLADGSLQLTWVRRARGAWLWSDGIDVPLVEDRERYIVTFGQAEAPLATWLQDSGELILPPAQIADFLTAEPSGSFGVRQQGNFTVSEPLSIAIPA